VVFIFFLPFLAGFISLAKPSCAHMLFGTLAPAGEALAPRYGIHDERFFMKKR
jgi:hypothetical protein